MTRLFKKVFDLDQSGDLVARAAYGMIEAAAGEFQFVQLRPWPKMISGLEASWLGGWTHHRLQRNRVQVWYNQPRGHSKYLTVTYGLSAMGTTLATIRAAHATLDQIAEIKRSDAILCHITNKRITDRVMRHYGFERHLLHRRGRHYIRRFYGNYPNSKNLVSATDSTGKETLPIVQFDAIPAPNTGVFD